MRPDDVALSITPLQCRGPLLHLVHRRNDELIHTQPFSNTKGSAW